LSGAGASASGGTVACAIAGSVDSAHAVAMLATVVPPRRASMRILRSQGGQDARFSMEKMAAA
jgi:hypothetical protein